MQSIYQPLPRPVKITHQAPYGECAWRIQTFDTREEAERMVRFYQSCGELSYRRII